MNKKAIITLVLAGLVTVQAGAQHRGTPRGAETDSWEVSVRRMPPETRAEITEAVSQLNGGDQDRGIIADVGKAVGLGLVSGVVDAIVTETFNLAHYRQRQKQEWMRMIMNENNYTDSITSIKGLNDFYNSASFNGAVDPSDMNFDGIEIRGRRNGREVLYLSCSIDRDRIEHIFRHSKFNLVIDSVAFYPYQCHLPNVTANGIRLMNDLRDGKATVRGDSIVRPGGNGFSFDERNNLRVGISFSIYSSWINQAVQIHRDVELGTFSFEISIPDNVRLYTYSRKDILAGAAALPAGAEHDAYLNGHLLHVEGDSFVVPRSYMPLADGRPMWGTGEYNIKVRVRESCRFDPDSDKGRHWREDYKRLRQMQKRGSEVQEYLTTLWNQYGNTMVKTSYSTALKTVAGQLTGQSGAGGASAAKAKATASGNPGAGQPAPPQK